MTEVFGPGLAGALLVMAIFNVVLLPRVAWHAGRSLNEAAIKHNGRAARRAALHLLVLALLWALNVHFIIEYWRSFP